MTCGGCADGNCGVGGANVFGKREAASSLKRYRKKGPSATTRLLLDALAKEGIAGNTVLDIGGGVGAIPFELFKRGATAATAIDASPAFLAAVQTEAARQGVADRITRKLGDFVALADETPAADVVTLDRVICCYPDMLALVGQSAAKAQRLYGAVYPRDLWWIRALRNVGNAGLHLFRIPFSLFIHATDDVDAAIRAAGLTPRYHHDGGYWQVVVYARPA